MKAAKYFSVSAYMFHGHWTNQLAHAAVRSTNRFLSILFTQYLRAHVSLLHTQCSVKQL